MTAEQAAAEDAVHRVKAEIEMLIGKPLPIPPQVVSALASVLVSAVALAGGASVKHAEIAGIAEATKISTDADAAKELGR